MSLTYELLKNCTTIVELFDVNELFSHLVDEKCKVYGLRAEFGYPDHLIPKNTYKYIAYIGISNRKLETSYGQAQFIEFYYEPKDVGILEHFFDMFVNFLNRITHFKIITFRNYLRIEVESLH